MSKGNSAKLSNKSSRRSPIQTRSSQSQVITCSDCKELKLEIEKLKSEIDTLKQIRQVECPNSEKHSDNFPSVNCVTTPTISSKVCQHSVAPPQPVTLHPGSPFEEFSAEKLRKYVDFSHRISNRCVKYFGEHGYSYGKVDHQPCDIPRSGYLADILDKFSKLYPDFKFNSVLLTKYENGQSTIPMHSDNEEMITPGTDIMTISLGASRTIKFEPKSHHGFSLAVNVGHGSCYSMSHESQHLYMHGVPRDNTCTKQRISITLRQLGVPVANVEVPSQINADFGDDGAVEEVLDNRSSVCSPVSLPQLDVCNSQQPSLPPKPYNKTSEISDNPVDTVYISSSMFRNLNQSKLSTKSHTARVLFYPGATAGGILQRLKADAAFSALDTSKVKQIFLLCGTNNVDNILQIPKTMRDSFNVSLDWYDPALFKETLSEIEELVMFLHRWANGAMINILNILPRASLARNTVINDLNCFIYQICSDKRYLRFISTELDRYLFSDKQGFRRNSLFNVKGSDNVHLNSAGTLKLGKFVKFLSHREEDNV